jgi:hypothetical protein
MAIQVNGTEVISNSRALNNIASVDATTAASISAAGVGGGAGSVDAWVNFRGDSTVSIRGSGNVSSVTDLDTGSYRANFSSSITDANYSCPTSLYQLNVARVARSEANLSASMLIYTSDVYDNLRDVYYIYTAVVR